MCCSACIGKMECVKQYTKAIAVITAIIAIAVILVIAVISVIAVIRVIAGDIKYSL